MPVKPDSRFAGLIVRRVKTPGGATVQAVALRLRQPPPGEPVARYRLSQGETVDLLAHRFYGDERLWWRILDANPVVYPLDLAPGDELNIPAPGPATRITRSRSF